MELKSTFCPACGGAVHVPPDAQRVACDYCGCELAVERGEGNIDLSVAQKLADVFEGVGAETRQTIQQSSDVTQSELKRLQIGQQTTTLQLQLSNVRAEIRALERESKLSGKARRQLEELRQEERACLDQLSALQKILAMQERLKPGESGTQSTAWSTAEPGTNKPAKRPRWLSGCGLGCGTFFAVTIACGMLAMPLDNWLFGTPVEGESSGLFFSLAMVTGLILGTIAFLYSLFPKAAVWKRFSRKRNAGEQAG